MKMIFAVLLLGSMVSCARFVPMQATTHELGSKRGMSCSTYIVGIHTGGKNHIYDAAKSKGITRISAVDHRQTGIFPFYWKDCTFVSGE